MDDKVEMTYEEYREATEPKPQNRLRSWAVWASLAGALGVLLTALGVWERIGISSDVFDAVVSFIGTALTAFGVLNNPTNREGF